MNMVTKGGGTQVSVMVERWFFLPRVLGSSFAEVPQLLCTDLLHTV